jgi:non-specific serine/threonine protein kinase
MLETIREFGLEQLEQSGEAEAVHRAHAEFYLQLVAEARSRIHGPEGIKLLNQLETEHDNLRLALAWMIEQGDAAGAIRLAYGTWRLWWMHSHLHEGRRWLERALAVPDPEGSATALRPRVLVATGYFARIQGDYSAAAALGEEALMIANETGDHEARSKAFHVLGIVATDQGELEQARTHLQAALALDRQIGDSHDVAFDLADLADVAAAQGNLEEATTLGEEALALWRARGDDWSVSWALTQLASIAHAHGDVARAISLHTQSLAKNAHLGDKELLARVGSELARVANERGLHELAAKLSGAATALREAIGAPLAPVDRTRHEQTVATARDNLATEAFLAAWEAGRAMSSEQLVEAAAVLAAEIA